MARKIVSSALGVATLACSFAAQAAYTITMQQVGPDVVATGSGSFSLAGLTPTLVGLGGGAVIPPNGLVGVGPVAPLPGVQMYAAAMSGPASFGTGVASFADSGTGAGVGMNRAVSAFGVPIGYVANTPLGTSTATWTGQTFASLGITPGTYVWTWGAGPTADSFTLIVNATPAPAAATSVPTLSEWGTISLAGMLALLGITTVRRRKG